MTHLVLPLLVIAVLMVVIAVMGAAMKRHGGKGRGDDTDDARICSIFLTLPLDSNA
jgi:hypothetical protein